MDGPDRRESDGITRDMEHGRRWRVGAMAAAASLVISGCSLFGGDTDEEDATALAETLAAGIAAGDVSEVPFTADVAQVQEQVDGIVSGLVGPDAEGNALTVEATGVTLDDDTATAALAVSWDVGGHAWSYESSATLVKADERWAVEFAPSVVEPTLVEGEALEVSTLEPRRADIIGAGDTALVTDRPVVRIGIDKTAADPAEFDSAARELADLVGVDAEAFAGRVVAAGERAFVEAITLRDADVTPEILDGFEAIPGARGIADELPLAPTRTFARSLLGSVGPATAEVIEESGGAVEEGDVVGLSGLQERYDESLRGTAGVVVSAVSSSEEPADEGEGDAGGEAEGDAGTDAEPQKRELFRADAADGEPLVVTLDEDAQIEAERVLADADGTAALVAIRPSDGHVLAAADTSPDGYPIATLGQYPPGSTFKAVTALALLRGGLSPDSAMTCPATTTVDGKEFENYDDYPAGRLGDIDLRTALANSCNTAFIEARDTASQAALADAAGALGLGIDRDLGYPVFLGSVPPDATGTEHAASMIGQGTVLASPLAMASVAASVAAGRTVTPVLVSAAADGSEPPAPLTSDEAAALQDMMRATVTDGSAAFLADVPGDPVIAKTGTAEFGTETPPDTHAWMIAARGDLAVAVFVENGDSGSGTAGPLLEDFLRAVT